MSSSPAAALGDPENAAGWKSGPVSPWIAATMAV
jgi:hypothetical protein